MRLNEIRKEKYLENEEENYELDDNDQPQFLPDGHLFEAFGIESVYLFCGQHGC
jgi:hypothetical protein